MMPPRQLYEQLYCGRGDMENRIKEQQLYLFSDRTSSATMRANQLRLYFSSLAYVLMSELRRRALQGTEFAKAQCHTIRLKLLKVGAQVRVSVRRISVSFASSYPSQGTFCQVMQELEEGVSSIVLSCLRAIEGNVMRGRYALKLVYALLCCLPVPVFWVIHPRRCFLRPVRVVQEGRRQ